VFADLDETVRQLLIQEVPLNLSEVDVSFDAPDREWSGRLSRPTINCFLYDVRENEEMHEAAWDLSRDTTNGTVTRRQLPLWINTTYNVTVWARAPEDEHRLLWRVLRALAHYRALPGEMAQGALKDWVFPILTRVARPEQARTSAADLWQALDNRIRPSLTYVATLALDPEVAITSPMTFTTVFRTRDETRWDADFAGDLDERIVVAGRVRDRKDNGLVDGARVSVPERGLGAETGSDGAFAFRLPRGTHRFVVQAPGQPETSQPVDVPSKNYDLEV
jgi:hypothetical protein